MTNRYLDDVIKRLGEKLGFEVAYEVPASESAWIDAVWYDSRFLHLPKPGTSKNLRRVPKLPVVGFEVEYNTALNVKHIKGSVSNLDTLGCAMGILVLGKGNLDGLRKRQKNKDKSEKELWSELIQRVQMWINTEAKPNVRIVLMTEDELNDWAKREGVPDA